jgi:glycosyltransferase involved in cell wall biosynthesis
MLSAVVLTKNDKKNIERCLKSLDFVDEIVLVDDYSIDNALNQISKIKYKNEKTKFKIFQRKLNSDFSKQRNFGMEKASGEWVLFLDADEEVSPDLKEEIKEVIRYTTLERNDLVGFYIKRRDFFWGKELKFGEVLKVKQKGILRLIKKGFGQWQGKVHEELKIENRKLKIGKLKNFINHYPHPTIKEFLQEINFYSSLRANELFEQGKKTNILEIIFYPLFKFILNYFIYLGFLDGPPGFVYAFMMSFHSFLVRGKLYIKNYTNDTNKDANDANYTNK